MYFLLFLPFVLNKDHQKRLEDQPFQLFSVAYALDVFASFLYYRKTK